MNEAHQQQRHVKNLRCVGEKIRAIVCEFFRLKGATGQFSMNELTQYVAAREAVAPDSPARIMRALRSEGVIYYIVVSRSRSLYRVTGPGQRKLW